MRSDGIFTWVTINGIAQSFFSRRVNAFFTAQYSSTEEAKGFSRIETDPDLNTRDTGSISALATT